MPIDSGGNITRPPSPIPVSGQTADAPQVNVPISDIYASMNQLAFLDGRKALRGNIPMNGHRAVGAGDAQNPQDYVTLAQLQALITPVGVVEAYTISSSVAPSGWVFANGQSLARATFPALWAAVQAGNNLAATQAAKTHGQYGPGDGSTTFTLPNLYADDGYFIRPISSGRGIGTLQADDFKTHNHGGATGGGGSHQHSTPASLGAPMEGGNNPTGNYAAPGGLTSVAPDHLHAIAAQGGTETRPKNAAYPVIIKA